MVRKLSKQLLERLVMEELSDLVSTKDVAKETEEVDADELADTLEKKVDMLKALKIKAEACIKDIKRLRALQESKKSVKKAK